MKHARQITWNTTYVLRPSKNPSTGYMKADRIWLKSLKYALLCQDLSRT
jgi:hypothetical protein